MYPVEPISYRGNRPEKAHEDDAAFDLKAGYCPDDPGGVWWLGPGETRLIPTRTELDIPTGFVGLICSRSGLALNRGLFVLNAPGVIDPGYRGDIGIVMHNLSPGKVVICPGDRIAQLLILPNSNFRMVERTSKDFSATERGESGFGSTGTKSRDTVRKVGGNNVVVPNNDDFMTPYEDTDLPDPRFDSDDWGYHERDFTARDSGPIPPIASAPLYGRSDLPDAS